MRFSIFHGWASIENKKKLSHPTSAKKVQKKVVPPAHDDKCKKSGHYDRGTLLVAYWVFQQLYKTTPFFRWNLKQKFGQKKSVVETLTVTPYKSGLLEKYITPTGATKLVRMSSSSNQQSRKRKTRGTREPASHANLAPRVIRRFWR